MSECYKFRIKNEDDFFLSRFKQILNEEEIKCEKTERKELIIERIFKSIADLIDMLNITELTSVCGNIGIGKTTYLQTNYKDIYLDEPIDLWNSFCVENTHLLPIEIYYNCFANLIDQNKLFIIKFQYIILFSYFYNLLKRQQQQQHVHVVTERSFLCGMTMFVPNLSTKEEYKEMYYSITTKVFNYITCIKSIKLNFVFLELGFTNDIDSKEHDVVKFLLYRINKRRRLNEHDSIDTVYLRKLEISKKFYKKWLKDNGIKYIEIITY